MLYFIKNYFRKLFGKVSCSEEYDFLGILRSLAEQGSWIELEKKAREVLSNDHLQGEAMALLAYSLQQQSRLEEALTFSVKAATLSPNSWLSQYVAGVTLRWLGREKDACDYLHRATIISPHDPQTLQQLNEAIAASEALNILDILRSLAEQGSWIELEKKAREVLSNDPLNGEAMSLAAYSLQQQGCIEEALAFSVQAATLSPSLWLTHFIAGVALKGLGREKEACNYLRSALAISPNDYQTLRQLTEAIAVSDGIEIAAAEYAAHCRQIGRRADIVAAPVCTVRDWAHKIGLSLLEAGEVEEIPFENPHVWNKAEVADKKMALSNKPYVADITDARIFSNSSLILTSDGIALSDTGGHPQFGRHVSFAYEAIVLAQRDGKVLLNFSDYQTREIDVGICLSGLASNAFGHWLPEFLPKLQFLKQHPDFEKFPIIVDAGMPQSHFDHLRRLADNPLVLLQANETLLCRRLLVAPSPAFSPVELFPNQIPVYEMPGLSPRALHFLRGSQPNENTRPRSRRIFLARKNMKWRRLSNEQQIAANLLEIGFETIYIEEMTVSEQIDLFQHAQWIVAPNGSALLNLIFADPSVKLLVLTQPNLFNWGTFQGPMASLGYQPFTVCGDAALDTNQKHSDYTVSLQHIRQALFDMGMYEALAEINKFVRGK